MKVYTYFEDLKIQPDSLWVLGKWKGIWACAGFEPIILGVKDFHKHPKYKVMDAKFHSFPTVNPKRYEIACFRRWCAMAVIGGFMVDYDVFPYGLSPFTPDRGLVFYDRGKVPCAVSGSKEDYEKMLRWFLGYEGEVDDCVNGRAHISDQTITTKQNDATVIPLVLEPGKHTNGCMIHFSNAHCSHDKRSSISSIYGSNNKPIGAGETAATQSSKAIISLGRYGDIVNVLPMAYMEYETSERPVDFVSSVDHVNILDGVSYVSPVTFHGSMDELESAVSIHSKSHKETRVAQVHRNTAHTNQCDSYAAEEWAAAGRLEELGRWPLVFDRRSQENEDKLAASLGMDGKRPVILVNLSGVSSPYPFAEQLMGEIKSEFSDDAMIVDLSAVRANRIYDLVGLMDRAAAMVTTDTSTLHLSAASDVPVVALISDGNSIWHGSRPHSGCVFSVRYKESNLRFGEIIRHLRLQLMRHPESRKNRWVHVVQRYQHRSPDAYCRFDFARQTWDMKRFGWELFEIWDTDRDSSYIDPEFKIPFLKDLWGMAIDSMSEDDVLVYTNDDTVLRPGVHQLLKMWVNRSGACCGMRNNFDPKLGLSPQDMNLSNTAIDYGRDVFAFKVWWLRKHWDRIPDVIIGTSEWDYFIGVYLRYLAGCDLSMEDMHRSNPLAEIPRGFVFHENHMAFRYANKESCSKIERYSVAECARMIQSLGIKRMHLSEHEDPVYSHH